MTTTDDFDKTPIERGPWTVVATGKPVKDEPLFKPAVRTHWLTGKPLL